MDKAVKAKKNSKKCSIPNCGKSYRTDAAIQLFEFPGPDTIMGQVWRVKCGFPTDAHRLIICHHHFTPDCCGKRRLKKDSVPSLNLTGLPESNPEKNTVETRMRRASHQRRDVDVTPDNEESTIDDTIDDFKIEVEQSLVEDSLDNSVHFKEAEEDQVPARKSRRLLSRKPKTTRKGPVDIELDDEIETSIKDESETNSIACNDIDSKEQGQRARTDKEVLQEALLCMKTLLERNAQRDEYTAFVEHIAHKLRTCKRDAMEIKIAQHYIENIIVNLSTGVYSQADSVTDPLSTLPSNCPDDQLQPPESQLLYNYFQPDIKTEPNV